jgi:hypothetical protein
MIPSCFSRIDKKKDNVRPGYQFEERFIFFFKEGRGMIGHGDRISIRVHGLLKLDQIEEKESRKGGSIVINIKNKFTRRWGFHDKDCK